MDIDDLCMGCLEPRGATPVCPACGWVEGTQPEHPAHLRPRTMLHNQYVLGRVLGHGGFGIAYIGWETNLEMKVAVKEFLPGDHATRGSNGTTVTPYSGESREYFEYGLTKFLEEGRAVARFNDHPGIMPVFSFFRENGTGYLVMPYLPGMTLKKYLDLKGGRIPFDHAVEIAMPVMDTLRAVHEVGLLHRDISPDNIYITTTARVKLLDFGAARHALGDRSQSLSTILKSGYAPFEQYQTRGRQGPYTDVYALAATIYRCITGQPPIEAPSRVSHDELAPPSALGIDISPQAEAVLLQALAMDARQRFQRVQELQDALADLPLDRESPFDGSPIGTIALDRTLPKRNEGRGGAGDARQGEGGGGGARGDGGVPPFGVRWADWAGGGAGAGGGGAAGGGAAGGGAAGGGAAGTNIAKPHPLRVVVDLMERPAAIVGDLVAHRTGIALAREEHAAARSGGLITGLIFGLLGTLVCLSLLISPPPYVVPNGGLSSLVWNLRVIGGLAGAVAMAIGGAAGLAGDRRGGAVVWAAGWYVIAFALAGMVVQLVGYLGYTSFTIWLFSDLPMEIWRTVPSLTPTVLVLLLLWARARAGQESV
jgi:Protein kinase domain